MNFFVNNFIFPTFHIDVVNILTYLFIYFVNGIFFHIEIHPNLQKPT